VRKPTVYKDKIWVVTNPGKPNEVRKEWTGVRTRSSLKRGLERFRQKHGGGYLEYEANGAPPSVITLLELIHLRVISPVSRFVSADRYTRKKPKVDNQGMEFN
jgi:hypothetical protein